MKIVVTGANGYLGTGIVKQLCDDGHEVIAVCHHDSEEIDKRAKTVKCDIFSVEDPFVNLEVRTFCCTWRGEMGLYIMILHMLWICQSIMTF